MLKKRVVCIIFALVYACALFSGCSKNENSGGEIDTYTAEEYSDDGCIYRGGFWAPDRNDKEYERYKNAGMNTVLLARHGKGDYAVKNNYFLGSSATDEAIELCEKFGLKLILNYGIWEGSLAGQTVNAKSVETTYDKYKPYIDDGTIIGMSICDEPFKSHIDDPGFFADEELYANFNKYYKDKEFYVNLNPWIFFSDHNGFGMGVTSTYREYVDYFTDKVLNKVAEGSKLMSTDVYPFTEGGLEELWLATYETISGTALANSAPISYYMQTQKQAEGRYSRKMTYEDMRLQVYTALCYGATQIMYYCYTCPSGHNYEYCMLDTEGNPSDYYYLVKRINEEIATFENVFASYEYKGTYPVLAEDNNDLNLQLLENKPNFDGNNYLTSVSANKGILVGNFGRESGEAYMFVNFGDTRTCGEAELKFTLKNSNFVAIYGKNGAKANERIVKGNNGTFEFTLGAGEGLFVVPLAE